MKYRHQWFAAIATLIIVACAGRLVLKLGEIDTGWSQYFEMWKRVPSDLMGRNQREIGFATPAKQAEFWLREVSNLEHRHDNPEVALGAAWILDTPGFGFIQKDAHVDTIGELLNTFELACRKECLAQMELAVQADPTNVEFRRAQALLLFQESIFSGRPKARRADWRTVLDECARADPDNALYDYLAADYLFQSSAKYDCEDNGDGDFALQVNDREQFLEANARFASGLKKAHFRMGTRHYAAIFQFLERSSVFLMDHVRIGGDRQIAFKAADLLFRLRRWRGDRADLEQSAGRIDAAIAGCYELLTMADQITRTGNFSDLAANQVQLSQYALANLAQIHHDYPDALSVAESEELEERRAAAQRDQKILAEVSARMSKETDSSISSNGSPSGSLLYALTLSTAARQLFAACVTLTLLALGISLWHNKIAEIGFLQLGWWRHISVWLLAIACSFLLMKLFTMQLPATPTKQTAGLSFNLPAGPDTAWLSVWMERNGPLVATVLAGTMTCVWQLQRFTTTPDGHWQELWNGRKQILYQCSKSITSSCCVAGLFFLATEFTFTPQVIHAADQYHQVYHARMTDPESIWKKVEQPETEFMVDE